MALTAAATATRALQLGISVCLIVEQDPIVTAQEVASFDVMSGGRVLLGIGAGRNYEEMLNHGSKPARPCAVMRERTLAMKATWTPDEAGYAEAHVNIERILSWPKPQPKPHPPVLVGGDGPRVLDRVLESGDGWLPERELIAQIKELHARAAQVGGAPVPVIVYGAEPSCIGEYGCTGTQHCICCIQPGSPQAVLRSLDTLARDLSLN